MEHASAHAENAQSAEFRLLEDVLTETSLLITTMRNIAELLQEKIVRRVAENRREALVVALAANTHALLDRETAMLEVRMLPHAPFAVAP